MSTPIIGVPYAYNATAKTWDAAGRPSLPASVDIFRLGIDQPDFAGVYAGVPNGMGLVNYTDYLTPRTINIDTPGTRIEGYNLGNVRFRVRANNCYIGYNNWSVTNNRTTEALINCDTTSVRGLTIERNSIHNLDQSGYGFNSIQGHDFTASRNVITGTVDGIRPNLGGDWSIQGNAIGYLGWWGGFNGSPTLNSGFQTHSDCIQTTYGGGEIVGNLLLAYVSEVVGTGTPGSGSNTGNTGSWYTQAEAEARRTEALTQTNPANKSYDGVAHKVNGYLTPLMCTRDTNSPAALDMDVYQNWFGGGALHVNALNTNLASPVGRFYGNRHYHDPAAGVGYRFRTDLPADVPQTGPNVNTWMDTGAVVPVSRP